MNRAIDKNREVHSIFVPRETLPERRDSNEGGKVLSVPPTRDNIRKYLRHAL